MVIDGFGLKSKEGAIQLVQQIVEGEDGDPFIFKVKTSLTSKVVPVKFISKDHVEIFVRQHTGKKDFVYRYKGF